MNFITVKEASIYNKSRAQAIYVAIRRGALKSRRLTIDRQISHKIVREYQIFTTKEWVDEWDSQKQKKEFNRKNGKPMFDVKEGEMNSRQAQEYLGLTKNSFFHYVYSGKIKYIRKGSYYVFDVKDLDLLKKHLPTYIQLKIA